MLNIEEFDLKEPVPMKGHVGDIVMIIFNLALALLYIFGGLAFMRAAPTANQIYPGLDLGFLAVAAMLVIAGLFGNLFPGVNLIQSLISPDEVPWKNYCEHMPTDHILEGEDEPVIPEEPTT